MDSTKNAVGGKKMSAKVKGYLILFALVFVSWLIFKILTPDNFGSATFHCSVYFSFGNKLFS